MSINNMKKEDKKNSDFAADELATFIIRVAIACAIVTLIIKFV
ncbi:hypothetical protein [Providencia sp. PROV128]|nr:hypothetical protein [Providencia sp. PROV128]